MRLNPDCIRDILLKAEEGYFTFVLPHCRDIVDDYKSFEEFEPYSDEQIEYHLRYLKEAYLIKASFSSGFIAVMDLTVAGHEFIANIRDNNNWNKTKDIAKKVGSNSIDSLVQIASNVVSAIINKHLGL